MIYLKNGKLGLKVSTRSRVGYVEGVTGKPELKNTKVLSSGNKKGKEIKIYGKKRSKRKA